MYDFDHVPSRFGTNSLKWDVKEGELPMWVADMDFPAAPEILAAMEERLRHGVFGYSDVPESWYDAYIDWWRSRHGFTMEKSWLIFCTGVIPAISSMVRKLTTPNEKVLINTPVYNIFFNSIRNNGCRPLECPLIREGKSYRMDMEAVEAAMADPQCSLMILCNPQNPTGIIWDMDTLGQIGSLAKRYHVTVIADEIHCDIVRPGKAYIPFASVSEECREVSVSCLAPTKTFNLAGLQTAAVSVPDPFLRHKVWRGLNTDEVAEPNAFACVAAEAAFTKGGAWLDELCAYLFENRRIAEERIRERMPRISVTEGDATYLMWLDLSALGMGSVELQRLLRERTGLYLSEGSIYGKGGEGCLRMNLACPRERVEDGLDRLESFMLGL
ncbi:MAG: pyridoxal phosphate-dependent aminotransferase [Lachnospiraceae bacterium]|nr:pyridoxal phosphate-dependent aminotransferase [Lachnospiraceae bacterium]